MQNDLLTKVITEIVNKKESAMEYGVSILNIPEFDYSDFVNAISPSREIEFFFLGFSEEKEKELPV